MRREAERGRGRGRPGSLQLYPTQPSQPPLRFTSSKEEICIWHFGFKNMNITVCHSCSHAPGAPGNPRQTPGVGAGHAPPAWPLPPLQTLSCKTHNKTECSQEPSRLWSSAGSLVPTLGQRGSTPSSSQGTHATTRHDPGHCSSVCTSSSSKDTTPEEATSEACRCCSQLPTGGGQSGWLSSQGAGSSSAGERQDSVRGEL